MAWYNLGLALLNLSLVVVLVSMVAPRIRTYGRAIAMASLKIGGVLLVTTFLITLAAQAAVAGSTGAGVGGLSGGRPSVGPGVAGQSTVAGDLVGIAPMVLTATLQSLELVVVATLWGTWVGLGSAYLLQRSRRRGSLVAVIATLAWVTPTFLLAAIAQELQAQIFNLTTVPVGGGYGTVSAGQIFWGAAVLGIRPATYIFRQARVVLDSEALTDHVRTARAKGVPWSQVVSRHIVRPVVPTLISTWLGSFRLMIGSLPLIEFFFAFPGAGQHLALALGVAYPDQIGHFQPDFAIGLVVALALIIVILEAVGSIAQSALDPRLNELRRAAA